MDRIESMLSDAFEDDAARFRETTFVEARGEQVAARVRRRRRTKAAAYSAVGVAAVAAAGLTMLPSHDEALTPADMPACLPFDYGTAWWDPDGTGANFLTGLGEQVDITLSTAGLVIKDAQGDPEPVVIPVEGRLLEGTTEDDEVVSVTLSTGLVVDVSLHWTASEIVVSFQADDGAWVSVGMDNPRSGFAAISPETRYWNYSAVTGDVGDLEVKVIDAVNGKEAWTLTADATGAAAVEFPDGTRTEFDAGDDGFLTFEWVGVTTFQILPGVSTVALQLGDEAWAEVDAQLVGPQYCLPDETETTAVDPTVTPSPDATSTVEFDG